MSEFKSQYDRQKMAPSDLLSGGALRNSVYCFFAVDVV